MGGITRTWFLGLLIITTVFIRDASALPDGNKCLYDSLYDVTFNIGSGSAEVDCEVYKYTSETEKYVYAYQISNIDSGIGLNFFSVGILDGANVQSPSVDSDPIAGYVSPVFWTAAGSPVQSVDYLFGTDTIGNGETSATLWFVSEQPSIFGYGSLFGTASGMPEHATGNLLTPIPEPATFVLLGIGGLVALIRKKTLRSEDPGIEVVCVLSETSNTTSIF